ncbi:MAG: FAD-binding protein, partial [Archaeoglobaceae archaeon]
MTEEPRIGVYVCHCGFNIAGTVDVKKVAEFAKTLPNVVVAKDYVFMCSEPGQDLIKADIKAHNLNRVVVSACSPSLHEITFRTAVSEAGLNKYLLEMANIREHCSWVHHDKEKATEKAKEIVRMAVAKARHLEPLEELEVKAEPSALVLGGGVAGMRAALELANYGFNVYLVEKAPTIGGKAALIGYIDPKTKGPDVVSKMFDRIKDCPRIQVLTNAELIQLSGFAGNYNAKIRINPRYVNEKCTLCGECEEVCPIEVSNEYNFGLNKRKAIFLPFSNVYPP